MKTCLHFSTLLLLISFCISTNVSIAQVLYAPSTLGSSSNNNVGIGISSPSAKLDILTNNTTGGLLINAFSGAVLGGQSGQTSTTPYLIKGLLNNTQFFNIDGSGHGDFGPGLDFYSNASTYLNVRQNLGVFSDNNRYIKLDYLIPNNGASFLWNNPQSNTDNNLHFRFGSSSNSAAIMSLSPTGSVGIGTTNFVGGFHKLYVGGSIIAEEMTAKLEADWPDYVFSADYEMMSNEALRAFIKENGHLPGIPTAAEVNQNGIEVAKTEALLLEKIEELTLRLLEMDKELKALQAAQNAE